VNLGSFRILLTFFWTSWGVDILNSAIFKLIRMLEWNTKHFPLNLQSGLTLSNFRDVRGGFELRNQIRHCKTVCIKINLCLLNYNRMRTQWTTKGNRDAGSSCLCDWGLHRYLRNFGGGLNTPNPPPPSPRYATDFRSSNSAILFTWMVVVITTFHASASPASPSSCFHPLSSTLPTFPSSHIAILFTEMLVVIIFTHKNTLGWQKIDK